MSDALQVIFFPTKSSRKTTNFGDSSAKDSNTKVSKKVFLQKASKITKRVRRRVNGSARRLRSKNERALPTYPAPLKKPLETFEIFCKKNLFAPFCISVSPSASSRIHRERRTGEDRATLTVERSANGGEPHSESGAIFQPKQRSTRLILKCSLLPLLKKRSSASRRLALPTPSTGAYHYDAVSGEHTDDTQYREPMQAVSFERDGKE